MRRGKVKSETVGVHRGKGEGWQVMVPGWMIDGKYLVDRGPICGEFEVKGGWVVKCDWVLRERIGSWLIFGRRVAPGCFLD